MKKNLITFFLAAIFTINLHAQIYVATTGNDSNTGKIDSPFLTITKGIATAKAGDTIYVRGGTYIINSTITIGSSKSGSVDKKYYLIAYPGEKPVLDFSSTSLGTRGIRINTNYWVIKGFDIKGAGDNGMFIQGNYNLIEFCSFYENKDTGLQLGGGASHNKVINCDSYYNADPGQGNADGFAPKLDVGTDNYFYGCRAWQNSDDGWDGYLRDRNDMTTTLENCWCFKNGYLKDGTKGKGNGNGFKMGGGDNSNSAKLSHNFILINCIAFDNVSKGFDQNNNMGSMTILNCTGYNNGGNNYSISKALNTDKVLTLKNCAELGKKISLGSFAVQEKNSWLGGFTVTSADFISLDPVQAYGTRKEDGSLPDIEYLHLADGSDLVDAGVDLGFPFNGLAPDLGAFESGVSTPVEEENNIRMNFTLEQNFPNPFNPTTTINFSIPKAGTTKILIYNAIGKLISELFNGYKEQGFHQVRFNAAGLPSGIYFYQIHFGESIITKKMTVLK